MRSEEGRIQEFGPQEIAKARERESRAASSPSQGNSTVFPHATYNCLIQSGFEVCFCPKTRNTRISAKPAPDITNLRRQMSFFLALTSVL
jgi:hypothetical protein